MIGWTDPNQPNPKNALKWLRGLTWDTYAYPEHMFNPEKPPACIFVPEIPILNKMIETVAKGHGDKKLILSKFSDFALPKPEWMINLDKERREMRRVERRILIQAKRAAGMIVEEDEENSEALDSEDDIFSADLEEEAGP